MNIEIRKPITPKEWDLYYSLRYDVLRKPLNQPFGSERDDGDLKGIHLALFEEGMLRAVARLDKAGDKTAQTRFVAVDPVAQGKGFGRLIMEAVEEKSIARGDKKMILHARDYALPFYLRLGYTEVKKSHKLFGVLQHYLMEKVYE